MQTHIEYLVKELFTLNTTHGIMPTTEQEFNEMFSNKEYEVLLRELLIGINIIKEED